MNNNQNEIILYQSDNSVTLEDLPENESFWLDSAADEYIV